MGSRNSTRRSRTMNDNNGENQESGGGEDGENPFPGPAVQPIADNHVMPVAGGAAENGDGQDRDLASILSYLIRSGQVRILAASSLFGEEDDDEDLDTDLNDLVGPANPPRVDVCPDTSDIMKSSFYQQVALESGFTQEKNARGHVRSLTEMLHCREAGMPPRRRSNVQAVPSFQCFNRHKEKQNFTPGVCKMIGSNHLPNKMEVVARYNQKAFCGLFSTHGDIFLSACQDRQVRVYDTTCGKFKQMKSIHARDVGWSVLDTAFSPDENYLIYSSWSSSIHLCNIHGDYETHHALPICPEGTGSFCIFSLTFSKDNREILGGGNDGCMYVYDRDRNERTLKIDAHEDDVNAVAFADDSSHILFSGGDDGLIKVWDRRTLSDSAASPVGILAGHMDGITFIDSKCDGRYFISNSKDQTIKLWDIRKFSSEDAKQETLRVVSQQNWDYRWQQVPKRVATPKRRLEGDSSLMTYRGHSVLHTLVRCRFSPSFTTGQRYIYTGCATGAVIIYDTLTGHIEATLRGHRACVRDVSWHPYQHKLITTSWDGTVGQWEYQRDDYSDMPDLVSSDSGSDSDTDDSMTESSRPRRSKRLRQQQRSTGSQSGNNSRFFSIF